MNGDTNEKYASQWIQSELLPIGGKWVYIVGIITDHTGKRKVRIAKGPLKSPGDKVPAQVQRLNIKNYAEWEKLTPLVKKFCDKLPSNLTEQAK